jgi:amino acid transporter
VSAWIFIWVLLASGSTWIMGPRILGRISPRSGVPVVLGLVSGGVSLVAMAADLYITGADGQKYFISALTASIALIVVAYLLIYPAFLALRLRRPDLERPFRAPGGRGGAWVITVLATGWSLLATVCLLWPGFGTPEPDLALPAGFEGQRMPATARVMTAGRDSGTTATARPIAVMRATGRRSAPAPSPGTTPR